MQILITGATGLIGSSLLPFLESHGHHVIGLRRDTGDFNVSQSWNPETGSIPPTILETSDAIIHLAGENIASGRWTAKRKERIRVSRVNGTRHLSETLASATTSPRTLIVASAIGFYGERGNTQLDESALAGTGFLPEVCQAWEEAAEPARNSGVRVVHLRIGIVLTPIGGALKQMLLPFKMGLGGIIGSGNQYMSWIALDDLLSAFLHVLTNKTLRGPINAVSPHAVTNQEFTKTLGKVLKRPTIFPLPSFAAKLAFGEMADALLMASTRVKPAALTKSGFQFGYPTLEKTLRHLLARISD